MSSIDPLFNDEYDPNSTLSTKVSKQASFASRPGLIPISQDRLKRIHPELWRLRPWMFWWRSHYKFDLMIRAQVAEQLRYGLAEPAIVVRLEPLVIACYTEELDCVAHLIYMNKTEPHPEYGEWYPQGLAQELVQRHRLQVGSRLLSVCTYWPMSQLGRYAIDLIPGPLARGVYCNFMPYIADFLTVHQQRVEERKRMIGDHEWKRCQELADDYKTHFVDNNFYPRDGRPKFCRFEHDQDWLPGHEPEHVLKARVAKKKS